MFSGCTNLSLGFNPRICKRCDANSNKLITTNGVSIHASVKDATKQTSDNGQAVFVSIHASVKDATNCQTI